VAGLGAGRLLWCSAAAAYLALAGPPVARAVGTALAFFTSLIFGAYTLVLFAYEMNVGNAATRLYPAVVDMERAYLRIFPMPDRAARYGRPRRDIQVPLASALTSCDRDRLLAAVDDAVLRQATGTSTSSLRPS
jgi:hypothetical protein